MPTIAEDILQLLHIEINGGADVHELDALISTRFPVLQQRLRDCGLVTEETATVYSQQDIRDIVAYIRDDLRQTSAGVETSLQKLESVLEDCFSENLESQTQSIPWQRFHFCFQVADMLAEKTQIPVETYRIGILQELANNIEEGGHCFAGTMNRLYMGYLAPNIMPLIHHPELVEVMSSEFPVAADLAENCVEAAAACSIFAAPHHPVSSNLPTSLECRVKSTIMPFVEDHDLDETVIAEITDAIISEVGCLDVNDQDLTDIAAGVMRRSYHGMYKHQ